MIKVLIVDDEKIEREGVKYLLTQEDWESEIYEAANGKQALEMLRSKTVDLLLTDIKMPHMDGLELSRRVKEENKNLRVVIFSGHNDFSFAQEAIRYGVSDYILKPVDPESFHNIMERVFKEISKDKDKEDKELKEKNFLQQYFLQNYLYTGSREILEKAKELIDLESWNVWHCAILLEMDKDFFDSAEEKFAEDIRREFPGSFFYLNLNGKQSLILFNDLYCDYALVAKQVYIFIKKRYNTHVHLAVSRKFHGYESLPGIMSQLEQQMEEKFYHPKQHIFLSEEDNLKTVSKEVLDSRLMQMISDDISRKDIEQLWRHFNSLKEKYRDNHHYSAMYIKFVFSNVIQELYHENIFTEERQLEQEIDRLYNCTDIMQILEITEKCIREFEVFINRSVKDSRDEVTAVKNYIYSHYSEKLSLETLAEKVFLSSGYLSFVFKKETGMNLNRFIRVFRMEKAKELLCTTNIKVAQISEKVGFANVSYFCRSFREYYGISPESYRKGTGEDAENS